MPIYVGINGIRKKLKEWPVGIGGVVHQQKEVWASENGVKKKIFSLLTDFNVWVSRSGGNVTIGGESVSTGVKTLKEPTDCDIYVYNQYGRYKIRHNNVGKSGNSYYFVLNSSTYAQVSEDLTSTIIVISDHGPCKITINTKRNAYYNNYAFVYAYGDIDQYIGPVGEAANNSIGPIGFSVGETLLIKALDSSNGETGSIYINGKKVATGRYTYTINSSATITCNSKVSPSRVDIDTQ